MHRYMVENTYKEMREVSYMLYVCTEHPSHLSSEQLSESNNLGEDSILASL